MTPRSMIKQEPIAMPTLAKVPDSVKKVVAVLLVLTFVKIISPSMKLHVDGIDKVLTKFSNDSVTPKTMAMGKNTNSSGITVSKVNETKTKTKISNDKTTTTTTTTTITTTTTTTTSTSTTQNIGSIIANSSETAAAYPNNTQITNESTTTLSAASTNTIYKDGFGGHNDVYNSSNIDKDVVIQMRLERRDRLGSQIQRPLFLMSYAHCNRQTFCIVKGREGKAKYFPGFETCPEDLHERLDWGDRGWKDAVPMFKAPITGPGVYAFKREDGGLTSWTERHDNCAFDESMRQQWGEMIVDASFTDKISNKTLVEEELFEETDDPNVVTVAINIRRGDLTAPEHNIKVILDQFYVGMLRHVRSILEKAGKLPEVHLFSEDYGMIDVARNISRNWNMYDGLVEHFHLAEDMRTKRNAHAMDMDLNLRDWRHFVKADILIVGGTFSRIPALGRSKHPDPSTGLPLTIDLWSTPDENGSKTKYRTGWSKYVYGHMPDGYELINLPEALAKHDTIPVEVFFEDLLTDWNTTYNSPDLTKQQQ